MSRDLRTLIADVMIRAKNKKYKNLNNKELILKQYFCFMPGDYTENLLISIMGSKKYSYFKFVVDWADGDKCLFSLDAEDFSDKVLLGYMSKDFQYSITAIDIQNINQFITEDGYRKAYIANKHYINLKDFQWMSD